jgi:hypothetical protein
MESVAGTELPRFFGRNRVKPEMLASATEAMHQARESAAMLSSEPMWNDLGGELLTRAAAIDGALAGARRLKKVSADTAALRIHINTVKAIAEDGVASTAGLDTRLDEILSRPSRDWSSADRRMVELGLVGKAGIHTPAEEVPTLTALRVFPDLIHNNGSSGLEEYRIAISARRQGVDIAARLDDLLVRPFEDLSAQEITTATADARSLQKHEIVDALTGAQSGNSHSLDHLTRERLRLQVGQGDVTAESIRIRLAELWNQDSLTEAERAEIKQLTYLVPDDLFPEGPRNLGDTRLKEVLEDFDYDPEAMAPVVERYRAGWKYATDSSATREQTTARARELWNQGVGNWGPEERAEMRTLLFDIPERLQPEGPRSLGVFDLESTLSNVELYPDSHGPALERYAAAWTYAADPSVSKETVTARARELWAMEPGSWGRAERAEMLTLLEDVPEEVRVEPPQYVGDNDLNTILTQFDEYPNTYGPALERYRTVEQFGKNPAVSRQVTTARVQELFDEGVDTWGRTERGEMLALLFDLPEGLRVDFPQSVAGYDVKAALTSLDASYLPALRRLSHYWKYTSDESMSRAKTEARAAELWQRGVGSWSPDERAEMATLIVDLPEGLRVAKPENVGEYDIVDVLTHHDEYPQSYPFALERFGSVQKYMENPVTKQQAAARAAELWQQGPSSWGRAGRAEMTTLVWDLPEEVRVSRPENVNGYRLDDVLVHTEEYPNAYGPALERFAQVQKYTENPVTKQQAAARAEALWAQGVGTWGQAERAEMLTLAEDLPEDVRIALPDNVGEFNLHDILNGYEEYQATYASELHRFGTVQKYVSDTSWTQEKSAARAAELWNVDIDSWGPAERAEMTTLIFDLPPELRVPEPQQVGYYTLKDVLAGYDQYASTYGPELKRYQLHEKLASNPELMELLRSEVRSYLLGAQDANPDAVVAFRLGEFRDDAAQLLEESEGLQKATVAANLMETGDYTTYLPLIADALPSSADGMAGQILNETRMLVDRNISRINGTTPSGAVVGYSNYPDFTELGKIRSNLQMVQGLVEPAPAAVEQPAVAAGDVVSW